MSAWKAAGNRLCARRILSFLRLHCFLGAAHELEKETAVFFDVGHLEQLAGAGRWADLAAYVARFMPLYPDPPSPQALTFRRCLHIYTVLGRIAAGGEHAECARAMFPLLDAAAAKANPRTAALHAFFHKIQQSPPRCFADWMRIWSAAAKSLKALALECPELKGKLQMPHCAPKSSHISLSGVRPVLRPYGKKKKVCKQKARDLATLIEEKRRHIIRSIRRHIIRSISAEPGADALGGGDGSREEDATKWEKKRKTRSTADEDGTSSTRSLKAARKDQ